MADGLDCGHCYRFVNKASAIDEKKLTTFSHMALYKDTEFGSPVACADSLGVGRGAEKAMKNLSIKRSLTLALGIMVAMVAAISALGFYSNTISASAIGELAEINVEQVNTINRAQVNLANGRSNIIRFGEFMRQGMDEKAAIEIAKTQEAFARSQERFAEFMAVELPEGSRRLPYVNAIEKAYRETLSETLLDAVERADMEAIFAQRQAFGEGYAAFAKAVRDFVHYAEQRGGELIAENARTSRIVEMSAVALLVLALIAALVVRMGMMRIVVKPLQETIEHFDRIAKGDLTARIEERGSNEIGQLFGALRNMQGKLRDLVLALRRSSDSVFIGAGEIATGSQDLSSRTEEQASALQETASSMEQMASTVRQNTDSAIEADRLSTDASQTAEAGGQEVGRTVHLMREIAESSRKINDIVEVIDAIAFQTNILALNASVEAARAGEQGRGFAVVASEVRSLASRSADSAKEIRAMIEDTTSRIVSGAEQAERSGQTIDDTVASIRQVSALMSEISSATREQNSGIEQINVAVTQMDSVTQQNASLVEQTSAAAASLEEQAKQLAELIASFKVNDQAAASSTDTTQPALGHLPAPAASKQARVAARPLQEEVGEF